MMTYLHTETAHNSCVVCVTLKCLSEIILEEETHGMSLCCAQSGLILCDPADGSPSGSSVHGILQAGILEWLPLPTPGNLPNPGINLCLLHWQAASFPLHHLGSPILYITHDGREQHCDH